MKTHKQQIAIAEVCGWRMPTKEEICEFWPNEETRYLTNPGNSCFFMIPPGGTYGECDIPNYLNDLNAMHEAEKVLTPAQHEMFCAVLLTVATDEMPYPELNWGTIRKYSLSTAAQRAEAFLRTIGKWEDGK